MWSRLVLVVLVSAGCRDLLGIEDARIVDAARGPLDVGVGDGGGDASGTPGEVSAALLAEWSGCMSLENFTATMMSPAWANLVSTGGQTCSNCHSSGEYGFVANPVDGVMFDMIATKRFYLQQFFVVDFTTGLSAAKVVVNRANINNVATAQPPHAQHPTFPVMNPGMSALDNFYERTRLRRLQGMCDPPRLQD
ncbi:MAG: hypothetical protein H0T89_27170 [Deltaproteobacteria bacterium]|nr:hypothetical protein [Deltaproteobacteria bacterium]MDQ3300722.1 hypothetical protein [Myxococcota bacterium]